MRGNEEDTIQVAIPAFTKHPVKFESENKDAMFPEPFGTVNIDNHESIIFVSQNKETGYYVLTGSVLGEKNANNNIAK